MATQDKDYEVGRGRPPLDTRFAKGRSGNPRGRPKRSRRLVDLFERELFAIVTVRENGRPVRMPFVSAIFRTTLHAAAKGDHKAQRLVFDYLRRTRKDESTPDALPNDRLNESDEAILERFIARHVARGTLHQGDPPHD